eukprot:s1425_g7.t1
MSPAMSAVFPLLLLTFWGRSSAAEPFCQFSGSDDASLLQAHASTRSDGVGQFLATLRSDVLAALNVAPLEPSLPQHFLFYIPLADNKKHSVESYRKSLEKMCRLMSSKDMQNVGLVGDVDAIGSMASSCEKFTHGDSIKLMNLEYDDVAASLPSGSCRLKFSGPALQSELVKIWLNKLPVLCWYAAERPDVVTTLIDANSEDDMLVWANRTGAQELQRGKLGVRFYQKEKLKRWPFWFGRQECKQDLVVWAKYMAVRGADCPELMQAYNEVLVAARDRDPDVGCQCFDEEYLLSRLYAKRPALFQLQGAPYAR